MINTHFFYRKFEYGAVLFLLFVSFLCMVFPSAAESYEFLSAKWPDANTTFHVDIAGPPGYDWTTAFEEAMDKWTAATDFSFDIAYDYVDPCQDPNDVPEKNGVTFSTSACEDEWGGSTLAVTISWTLNHEFVQSGIVFNSNEDWSVYSGPLGSDFDFRRVAVHELGHTIGLGHEDDVLSIMSTYVGDIEDPQADDIYGVNMLYFGASSITAQPECAGKKVLSVGKSFQTLSNCYSKEIIRPDNAKFVACSDKAFLKIQNTWDKEEAKAFIKGYDCTTATSVVMYDLVEVFFEDVDDQIRAGLNMSNSEAAKLGKKLLKAVGRYGGSLLKAEGANLKRPDQAKRSRTISKANDKFAASWDKAVNKAEDKGVTYSGPSMTTVENLMTTLVMDVLTDME